MYAKALSALAVCVLGVATAADPPAVRMPEVQVIQRAGVSIPLTTAELFVIDSDVPAVVTTSPLGVLAVTVETGPVKIKGANVGIN